MTNLLERSILMTLGAAVLTKEIAESLAGSLTQKGEDTTASGREAIDEAVAKAKDETKSLRLRFDDTIQRNFRELGLAQNTDIDELKLKVAQLEHRLNLLEGKRDKLPVDEASAAEAASQAEVEPSATEAPQEGKAGVVGEAAGKEPDEEG